jgi:hypothetical protein
VNLVIAAFLYVLLAFTTRPGAVLAIDPASTGIFEGLLAANLLLAVFNLLPAFPMDGGRVLRAALALRMDRVRATRTAATVGQVLAVGLGIWGLMGNPFMILIAAFVWIGAGSEAAAVETDARLSNQPAGRAMITRFQTLAPSDTLGRAIDLTLAGTQKDFPVLDGARVVGVLSQAAILRGLREGGATAPVADYLQPIRTVDVATPLSELLENLQSSEAHLVCITRDGALAGVVDLDNIIEYLRIQQALGRR